METPSPRLAGSHALWERARRVMPGGVYGHQNGAALGDEHPRFLARAERSRIWDVDGNEYVDWMCAYGPMILGYGHPAIEAAVAEQLAGGDCLPLPGPRMVELAERLVAVTPRADFAVFGKNGADATSWAVDVAARPHRPAADRPGPGRVSRRAPVGPPPPPRRARPLPRRPARVRLERPRRAGRPLRRAPGRDRGGDDRPVRPPDRRGPRPRLLRGRSAPSATPTARSSRWTTCARASASTWAARASTSGPRPT